MQGGKSSGEQADKRSQTRERLVRIGTELLSEKGFGATGIDEVLRAAEVPKGSFYHYFDSKADFGLAVVDNYASIWERKLARILGDRSAAPLRRIDNYIAEGIAGLERYSFRRGCLIGNIGQEVTTLDDEFRDRLIDVFSSWTDAIAACLAEARDNGDIGAGVDVDTLSRFFWLAWEGAVLQAKLQRSTRPLADVRDVLFGLILKTEGGLASEPRRPRPRRKVAERV
jgi:TetR/AcrR family transcriptional repressor of nem operon